MDGFTLLEHLKRSPQPPAIIIVSGNADEQEARQLLQRGAVDYVMKPVDLNYLRQAIAAAAGTALP
jgi:two-component system NtrC family response regulator